MYKSARPPVIIARMISGMVIFMKKTRLLLLVSCLLFIVPLVAADPISPTTTRVFITHNGVPIDSSVQYTMSCSGTIPGMPNPETGWLYEHGIKKILNSSGEDDYIYSYTATCNPGACDIYEVYDTWMMRITSCDIRGTYKGTPFLIRNFSGDPAPQSCRHVISFGKSWRVGPFYAVSPDDEEKCRNEQWDKNDECGKIIGIVAVKTADGGTMFMRTTSEDTTSQEAQDKYEQCRDTAGQEFNACIKDHGTQMNETELSKGYERYCELRFDIPSDSGFENTSDVPDSSSGIPGISTDSFWCGLLHVFGISC